MGKQKVEIKVIEDKSKRHTTFTKRRQGLKKKARKFFLDSHSNGAVIVLSQAGNCFTYGNPKIDTVLRRYVTAVGILPKAQWKICEDLEKKDAWNQRVQELGLEEATQLLAEIENIERKFAAAAEVECSVDNEVEKSAEDEKTDGGLCSGEISGIPLMPQQIN